MAYLTLKEVARLLGVCEKTVYRLLGKGELPAVKVGRQWRFRQREIETWLRREKPESYVVEHLGEETEEIATGPLLSKALQAGGIFFKIIGDSREEVIKNAVNIIFLGAGIDHRQLAQAVIAREKLCSTSIGRGIALPHPRHPRYAAFDRSRVSLCFLENQIDFGAIDKRPVDKLFFIFAGSEREHLQLLRVLALILQQAEFIEVLEGPGSRLEILRVIRRLEKRLELEAVLP